MNNVNVLAEDDASIQLTWDYQPEEPPEHQHALFTARGKDHDLTAAQLRRLAWAALTAAMDLDRERPIP